MLNKVIGPFREFGPAAGFLYALDRVLSSISPRMRVYVYEFGAQPIGTAPLLPERLARNFEVRELKAGAPEMAQMPVPQSVIAARLAQGARCLGGFSKGRFIGYMWFCRNAYDEDEARCTYVLGSPADSVFDFDYYLYPDSRLGTGFAGLWGGANAFLHAEGVRYTYSRLTRFNLATRRAHARLGLRVVGRGVFLKLGAVQVTIATVAPWFNVSTTGSAPVRITLHPPA